MKLISATVMLTLASVAGAQPFTIEWSTIDGGGRTDYSGAGFEVVGTVGQHDAGVVGGVRGFSVIGGFWFEPADCPADFNDDGFVDFFDFDDFVVCFEGGPCPPGKSADFNGDGFADFFDYDDFVLAFETGCP